MCIARLCASVARPALGSSRVSVPCADRDSNLKSDEESESAVYAIVRSGGQQQKVAVGDVIEIDKVATARSASR